MTMMYRFLGVIVNVFALLIAVSLVLSIGAVFSSPLMMLYAFIMSAVVLYAWFSLQFHVKVLRKQETVKRSLRDWIRVNGFITLLYSIIMLIGCVVFIFRPNVYLEAAKTAGYEVPIKNLQGFFIVMALYSLALLLHVVWTFLLVKKNQSFFKE